MKHKPKPEPDARFLMTNKGLMKCTVPDFDAKKYKGLNANHPNGKKVTQNRTNVGDPNKKR